MSSGGSGEETPVEVLFEVKPEEESSEEPPMEEWSSLALEIPEQNKKILLFDKGLYYPGSGEICAKYITMSDSSIFRHPYYNYPAVLDPGIEKALFNPEDKIIYPDDGQELYLATCKEMNQCPVKIFYKGLVEKEINLRYYCVNPVGVRAMTMALSYNRIVKVLDLTDNFLNQDACYHLGEMLIGNSCLTTLVLSGCRIGPEGVRRLFDGMHLNRSLKDLNLNKNEIGDAGLEHIASAIFKGIELQNLHLSYNGITGRGTVILAEVFETHNKFVYLDLSWNQLFSPLLFTFLTRLGDNTVLEKVNLAWNALSGQRICNGIRNLLRAPNLRYLDLSNNRIGGRAMLPLLQGLMRAKKLETLDLSHNPMEPSDALNLLNRFMNPAVKIQNVIMDNVYVDKQFLEMYEEVKSLKFRQSTVITYGGVTSAYTPLGPDPRELLLNRAEFLAKKPKKTPVDFALVILQMVKDGKTIVSHKEFSVDLKRISVPFDEDLIEGLVRAFPGPSTPKMKTINLLLVNDYIARKWPDRKLPPTPPPEPEPEPLPKKNKKGKGNGK